MSSKFQVGFEAAEVDDSGNVCLATAQVLVAGGASLGLHERLGGRQVVLPIHIKYQEVVPESSFLRSPKDNPST